MIPFISLSYTFGSHSVLNKGWKWENVITPDNKLYYVEEGELIVEINGKVTIAKAGDIVLIPAFVKHSCYLTEMAYAKKYWVHFSLKRGSSAFFNDYPIPVSVKASNPEKTATLFDLAISSSRLADPFKSLKTSKYLLEIVLEFLQELEPISESANEGQIEKAIEFIDLNFANNYTLNELSAAFCYTPNHFIKKFKEKTGYTPIKYLTAKKINEAKLLLEHSQIPVSEIMEKVGFTDPAYFSKTFKKALGSSPRNYRESVNKDK